VQTLSDGALGSGSKGGRGLLGGDPIPIRKGMEGGSSVDKWSEIYKLFWVDDTRIQALVSSDSGEGESMV
jgi:hypothetical protein